LAPVTASVFSAPTSSTSCGSAWCCIERSFVSGIIANSTTSASTETPTMYHAGDTFDPVRLMRAVASSGAVPPKIVNARL
jgi:hypothetical protein